MRPRQTVVPGASVTRLLGVALLASSAAACSSDANRFSYKNADQFYTASVPQPSAASLAPMANVGGNPTPPGGVSGGYPQAPSAYPQAGAYPQAPAQAGIAGPQAFPGDYRAPLQPSYDQTATGSVPGSVARAVASPSSLIPAPVQRAAASARNLFPARAPSVTAPATVGSVLEPMVAPALAAPSRAPVTQPVSQRQAVASPVQASRPFPERPRDVSALAQPQSTYARDAAPVLAPDPIVTGTAPQGAGWTTTGATRITLGPGETIYNLSKRYGVPAREIMKANGIADASKVSVGRQLLIPVYVYSRQAPVSAPDNNPKTRAARSGVGLGGEARQDNIPVPVPAPIRDYAVLPTAPSLRSPQNAETQAASTAQAVTESAANTVGSAPSSGHYDVKSGDTLSKIARNHGVSVDALKAANSLSGSNIRIGQKLAIPGPGAGQVDGTRTASVPAKPTPKAYTPPVQKAQDGVAAKTRADTASVAPAATGIGKFRWPARGQVITGFAKTENGKRNDGIDISMPTGTPIKAAENGVVIYSGDGLKEYGKTVLIRHDDGLVTVYAHADSLKVNRGDKIARGQVIASSGMTGTAKTPRLHFEVRKNASPVDPITYLE